MPEELTTKQFVDIKTGKPISNPVYIGDVYDKDGADAVLRLFGQDKTRDTCGRVGDYRITDDPVLAENHLWPDGSPIDPAAWPELHAYAARLGWQTDAAGHFLLPDLRGKYLVGSDSRDPDFAAGAVGGEKAVALTAENNGPHSHGIGVYEAFVAPTSGDGGVALGDAGVTRSTVSAGQGAPHNNLPPYRAVYIQLRAKPDPVVAQEVAADRLSTARKIGGASFDGSADITLAQMEVPNPNLLDNSDFLNPVNQRWATVWENTSNNYTIDRWYVCGNVALTSTGISLTKGTAIEDTLLAQKVSPDKIRNNMAEILSVSASINGEIIKAEGVHIYERETGMSWADIPYIIKLKDTDIGIRLYKFKDNPTIYFACSSLTGQPFTVQWAKLEIGPAATPWQPKGIGAELAECRRYFRRYSGTGAMIGGTSGNGGSQLYIMVDVSGMRLTAPTVSASDKSTFTVYYIDPSGASGSVVPSAPIRAYAYAGGQAMIPVSLSPNTTSTANFYVLRTGAGGYLDISADL